jgi:AraC family transcriptional regulator
MGIYDPGTPNGRLLLGLKGTISELELHTIRSRMTTGLIAKAERGDLALQLPAGLVRDPSGVVTKDPNIEVQERLLLLFETFLKVRTAAHVMRTFTSRGLALPRRDRHGDLRWQPATVSAVTAMLKNPAYAGAFVYGRTWQKPSQIPGQRPQKSPRRGTDWRIVVRDKYPTYIDWETFEKIQAMLRDNRAEYQHIKSRGIPRDGAALLHGITYCGECGHKSTDTDKPQLGRSAMASSEGYGQGLAERLHIERAPAILSRVLRTADMAVTETRCDVPVQELSASFQPEDAFLITLTLRDFPNREYWEEGRLVSVSDVRVGQTCIHDLKRNPTARLDKPHHVVFFYLPRGALDAIAEDADARRIGDLDYKPVAIDDATISGLGTAMLPALSHPDRANQMFIDHVLLGLGIHVAQTYGGMRPLSPPIRGGLAAWQVRRAKEILTANLDGRVPLNEVARACGLSVSYFARAFRRSVGVAPHNWLLTLRVEVAKQKLRDGRLSLRDVALACGFADQSHLTQAFTRIVGVSPDEISLWASASAATLHHYRASPFLIRPWKRNPSSFLGPTRRIIARLV